MSKKEVELTDEEPEKLKGQLTDQEAEQAAGGVYMEGLPTAGMDFRKRHPNK